MLLDSVTGASTLMGAVGGPLQVMILAIVQFLNIYVALLLIRVLLSWFPNVNWSNPIFSTLSQLTDPYLNLFRNIVPALGGMDFSPMLAFFALQILSRALEQIFLG